MDDIRLVVLPGYGYAKISGNEKMRFARLMETYFNEGRNIKMVFSLIDMRHSPTADDIDMLNFLLQTELPFTVVLTKSDKLNKTEMNDLLVKEVQSKIDVESKFADIKEEYYEYMKKYAMQLDNENEFRDLMAELATGKGTGIKSYSELASWMERAYKLIH